MGLLRFVHRIDGCWFFVTKAGSIGNYQVSELSNSDIRKSTLGRLLSISSTVLGTFFVDHGIEVEFLCLSNFCSGD
jgi:hypothetical protein